jgi:hypothetical protein
VQLKEHLCHAILNTAEYKQLFCHEEGHCLAEEATLNNSLEDGFAVKKGQQQQPTAGFRNGSFFCHFGRLTAA